MATATSTTPQMRTEVKQTVKIGKDVKAAKDIEKLTGRPLGSPINSMEPGQERKVTLTGNIEIREYNGIKGAYFTTKEGISIKVNASFNAETHKEGTIHTIVCREFPREDKTVSKYASFKEAA
jgi:hypothetical protein